MLIVNYTNLIIFVMFIFDFTKSQEFDELLTKLATNYTEFKINHLEFGNVKIKSRNFRNRVESTTEIQTQAKHHIFDSPFYDKIFGNLFNSRRISGSDLTTGDLNSLVINKNSGLDRDKYANTSKHSGESKSESHNGSGKRYRRNPPEYQKKRRKRPTNKMCCYPTTTPVPDEYDDYSYSYPEEQIGESPDHEKDTYNYNAQPPHMHNYPKYMATRRPTVPHYPTYRTTRTPENSHRQPFAHNAKQPSSDSGSQKFNVHTHMTPPKSNYRQPPSENSPKYRSHPYSYRGQSGNYKKRPNSSYRSQRYRSRPTKPSTTTIEPPSYDLSSSDPWDYEPDYHLDYRRHPIGHHFETESTITETTTSKPHNTGTGSSSIVVNMSPCQLYTLLKVSSPECPAETTTTHATPTYESPINKYGTSDSNTTITISLPYHYLMSQLHPKNIENKKVIQTPESRTYQSPHHQYQSPSLSVHNHLYDQTPTPRQYSFQPSQYVAPPYALEYTTPQPHNMYNTYQWPKYAQMPSPFSPSSYPKTPLHTIHDTSIYPISPVIPKSIPQEQEATPPQILPVVPPYYVLSYVIPTIPRTTKAPPPRLFPPITHSTYFPHQEFSVYFQKVNTSSAFPPTEPALSEYPYGRNSVYSRFRSLQVHPTAIVPPTLEYDLQPTYTPQSQRMESIYDLPKSQPLNVQPPGYSYTPPLTSSRIYPNTDKDESNKEFIQDEYPYHTYGQSTDPFDQIQNVDQPRQYIHEAQTPMPWPYQYSPPTPPTGKIDSHPEISKLQDNNLQYWQQEYKNVHPASPIMNNVPPPENILVSNQTSHYIYPELSDSRYFPGGLYSEESTQTNPQLLQYRKVLPRFISSPRSYHNRKYPVHNSDSILSESRTNHKTSAAIEPFRRIRPHSSPFKKEESRDREESKVQLEYNSNYKDPTSFRGMNIYLSPNSNVFVSNGNGMSVTDGNQNHQNPTSSEIEISNNFNLTRNTFEKSSFYNPSSRFHYGRDLKNATTLITNMNTNPKNLDDIPESPPFPTATEISSTRAKQTSSTTIPVIPELKQDSIQNLIEVLQTMNFNNANINKNFDKNTKHLQNHMIKNGEREKPSNAHQYNLSA